MNYQSKSRKFDTDVGDGDQLSAKRLRAGDYPTAIPTALSSLDSKIPVTMLLAPPSDCEPDYFSGSLHDIDRGLNQQNVVSDSIYEETPIIDNNSLMGMWHDSDLLDGVLSPDSMVIDTVPVSGDLPETPSKTPLDNKCINAIVCYGTLCDAKVKFDKSRLAGGVTPDVWDQYYELAILQQNGVHHLFNETSDQIIGVLDIASSRILKSLWDLPEITFTAIIDTAALRKLTRNKNPRGKADASINISGPERLFTRIGDALEEAKGYLQHPFFLAAGIKYMNPHWFYPDDTPTDLRHLIGPVITGSNDVGLAKGLENILQDLGRSETLDTTNRNSIDMLGARDFLTTPLKSHQEEGVMHILSRENYEYTASATEVIQNVIGHAAFKERLIPLLGGIYADVMGLGKTLTMLTSIVGTLKAAEDFVHSMGEVGDMPKSRATLVVASSHRRHFRRDTLRICIFHGASRTKLVTELANNDIVLTTYHTLVADQKKAGLMQSIEWFRVVLDEAHWIRNSTSQQFRAACSVAASRRWCLSGTPISNSLYDLQSLLAFLHFSPFSQPAFFRKHIIEPLGGDSPDKFRNLRMLLHAICFRRTSDLLSLPPCSIEQVIVTLDSRESELYEGIRTQSKKEYEEVANMKSSTKKYTVLFTATMKLRRLCNHGSFQQLQNSNPNEQNTSVRAKSRASTEYFCEYCYGDNADLGFSSDALAVCPECSRTLGPEVGTSSGQLQGPMAKSSGSTPLEQREVNEQSPSIYASRSPFKGLGAFSSKLNAVVNNIQRTPASSKKQRLLIERGINPIRIDGQTSFADRQSILKRFCEEPDQTVLLLSIATGAVGLTLTAADRVHIVEPQWNPLVEEQAIGRALRIGQTRPVTVFKYITRNTIEEVNFILSRSDENCDADRFKNIVSLQKRKSHLARISLDGDGRDHLEEKLDDYMFVLQDNGPGTS
ncbi:SNF2 family N-terminal domain-containing protein [Xylariaceae sp. FL0255]|nr:SNF2 family N-terminal domain-containing protein [Xylariaceae sp. FL0255]